MLINLRNALMSGKRLPYDAEVEYLESTGTQYIDTNTIDDPVNNIVQITFSIPTSTGATMNLFGSSGVRFNYVSARWGSNRYNLGPGATTTPVLPISVGDIHVGTYTLTNNALTYTLDGVSAVYSSSLVFNNLPFAIFGIYGRPDASPFIGRVYGFKVIRKSDGTVIADYIPVRKGTVGYLYDRVSDKLFGNAGTGDFVLGQDVVPVEYIESHGTEYIDTGVVGGSSSKVEIVASSSNTAQNMGLFGSRNTSLVKAFTIWQRVTNTSVRFDFADDTSNRAIAYAAWDTSGVNTVIKDGLYNTLNGVAGQNNNTATFTCEYPFYLFSINTAGAATANASARVYSCKIYQNGVLVRDYKAIRVGTGSTWEGAMMDVLTRRVYRNAGTGAFIYGNDLKYPIPSE